MTRRFRERSLSGTFAAAVLLLLTDSGLAAGQAPALRITEPTVVVTALKEPADIQNLPLSVTAVTGATLTAEGITAIGETAIFAPNTFFSEFSARKLSFPHFRGVSGGPGNPAITTYVDGVPMIHTNAANGELVDVGQVELVRGGQSALYGRNALGGIINIASGRPSLTEWTGSVLAPFGNFSAWDLRGTVSGPLSSRSGLSVSAGRTARDGYTTNQVTGNDIDSRSSTFGKAQVLWTPGSNWETRFIFSAERARDGDYALADLGALRQNPFEVQRDFEGHTDRDIVSGTFLLRHEGSRVTLSTITGIVNWNTFDATDLDYSPLPALTRTNDEQATQFTQEVRLSSAASAPAHLGTTTLRWQAGVFFFTQGYDQDAINTYAPYVLSPFITVPVDQHTPVAALDDLGIGVYGQGTFTMGPRIDLAVGARVDYESKDATLDTSFSPPIGPPTHVVADRSFSNVSPQASFTYHMRPDRMVYASIGSGYKSGGFNPAAPPTFEAFGEEHNWQIEGGVKTAWAGGRVMANAAFFYIDWTDLQLNVPNPQVPAQFYVANVGDATSTGAEFEISGRASMDLDLFAVMGLTRARFGEGSESSGVDVSDNLLPSTPDYTATFGARYHRALAEKLTLVARGEISLLGSYQYDDANTAGQDAYSLTNFRAGVQHGRLLVEFWMKNAFDTQYVPLAFAYPGLAPSGFVGEAGAPRTFGVRAVVEF